MKKLFGTDGVRGVANDGLTPLLAFELGRAGAYVLTKHTTTTKVLVAKDGRRSGDMLEAALTAGLCSIGAEVHQCGIIPTPAVAFLIKKYGFDAGVMISASHNPMEDNGIKFFDSQGLKLPDQLEAQIEEIIATQTLLPTPTGKDVGTVHTFDAVDDYVSFLVSTVPNLRFDGKRVVLDCANGATSAIAQHVFEALGATVHAMHNSPDGCNINANCGSTHMESLVAYVKENGADIGIAFDGDGDRMLAVDNNGKIIDGDIIMAICGLDLFKRDKLPGGTIVATVMSNMGLEVFCRKHGMNLYRAAVGDRYVLEKMLADDLPLGGEQSGHMIFREYNTTGDGILAGVQLLSVLQRSGKTMSELASICEVFPQVLINVKVPSGRMSELATNPSILQKQSEIEALFEQDDRLLLRPSGTEPLVRVMLEGRDKIKVQSLAEELAAVIEAELGQ